jgi:hypothetical protein
MSGFRQAGSLIILHHFPDLPFLFTFLPEPRAGQEICIAVAALGRLINLQIPALTRSLFRLGACLRKNKHLDQVDARIDRVLDFIEPDIACFHRSESVQYTFRSARFLCFKCVGHLLPIQAVLRYFDDIVITAISVP